MNKIKEKSGKFPFGKKKKNKNKEAKATEEERVPLKVSTPEEDVNQTPNNHIQPSVVTILKETQGRINERPVDVGDVVVAPQNRVAFTKTSGANPFLSDHQTVSQPTRGNGQTAQITVPTEPKGPSRVHSFTAKTPEQSSSQKEESVTYENENSGSSKKKKGQSFLGSLTGKSSKKARKSLNEVFETEKTKTTQDDTKERQSTIDQESSSPEEMDDHWDDDPRNPFSASFVLEEDHPPQSPINEKDQLNKIAGFPLPLEEDRTRIPEKDETPKGSETESKKKKRKLKVPSFRGSKKAGSQSSPPVSPHKTASEPTHLTDLASTETEPAANVTLRLLQPPQKPPRLHSYSNESPDKLVSEENTGQFLSREERNKSKQFSSMRVSNKNPRPALWQTAEKDNLGNNKENESDTYDDDDELPPNINKKSRQGLKIFASFRKNKPTKMKGLEKVAEHDAEETKDDDVSEISNPLSSGSQQSVVISVRSSAPPNFAAPVMGTQSIAQCEISKQRSQTLPPTRTFNLPQAKNDEIDQRARTESAASGTLPRIEEIRETSSEPKVKKIKIRSRIRKSLSLKKSSNEADEIRQAYSLEEENTIEEEKEIIQEDASLDELYSTSVQETEVDLETRKRELESVFKEMESEEEEEEKPKAKNPKQFLKDLKKKKKKKKSDSEEPEAFPLMDRNFPVENNAKKNKNAAEQIIVVKSQLGELKEIAHDNIKKMEEREDNLEDLNDRAEKLDEAAGLFHKVAVEVRTEVETCCSKRAKRIALGVVIAVLVLILIILIAVLSNKSEKTEVRTIHIIHVINGTAPYITPSPG